MSQQNTVVRPARPDDVAALLTLIGQLAEYARRKHEMVADEALLTQWLFGERPAAEALVAESDGAVVGMAIYFHTFSTFLGRPGLYLEDLFVTESRRSEGIGRQLLAAVADIARRRQCERLEWSVLNWNEPAIRLYQSLGARPLDDSTVYRMTPLAIEALARGEP